MIEPENEQILGEASAWFIENRSGPLSANAHEAFMAWLRKSPEHIRAYLEVSRTYVSLPAPGEVPPAETARLLAKFEARETGGVVALDGWGARTSEVRAPLRTGNLRRRVALAASLLLVVGGAITGYFWTQRGLYTTGPGEARTVTLEDASRIELNARTRLRVRYTAGLREVELLEGQALFQVAKDHTRPFLVHSAEATVRAVGTEFDVYRKTSGTTVTVLEGRVAVYSVAQDRAHDESLEPNTISVEAGANAALQHPPSRPTNGRDSPSVYSGTTARPAEGRGASSAFPAANDQGFSTSSGASIGSSSKSAGSAAEVPDSVLTDSSGTAAIFLSAGEQVTVTAAGVPAPKPANVSAATAWTRGQLEFEETPLSEVADEFNRSSTRTLVLDSPQLNGMRISGVYSSVDPTSLILFLKSQPDLIVSEEGSQIRVNAH